MSLGSGERVPYPEPTSPAATSVGRANVRTNTKPEQRIRSELHRLGLRYRKDRLIKAGALRTRADVVFGSVQLAVFIDGCFWHVCPLHFHMPKSNLAYWEPKLAANQARDRRVDVALRAHGWTVLRLWEHESADTAAQLVVEALAQVGHPGGLRLRAESASL